MKYSQMNDLGDILATLQSQQDLTQQQMRGTIAYLLTGQASASLVRDMLTALARKGETVDELTGAALALRESMIRIEPLIRPVVDTCGTGGDGSKTFNISTAAALALSSAGVPVAKHGNRKITSSTGSADVLAELGINLEAQPAVVEQCLRELGICFCFAPYFHPAMKHVGEVRRLLEHPTIFNRLGPLANPALADCQVLGVGDPALQMPMAQALQQLGTRRSIVVHGSDGVDELSISTTTRVLEVTPEAISEHLWSPDMFGLREADRQMLFADNPPSSAACIRRVFAGESGPMRDVVVMNAAAGLWLTGLCNDLRQSAEQIEAAIDSGKTRQLVEQLGARSFATTDAPSLQ